MNKKIHLEWFRHGYCGSALLITAVIAAALLSGVCISLAKIHQISYKGLSHTQEVLQSQQFAAGKAEMLKKISYKDLTSQTRRNIVGVDGYDDEVILGNETLYGGYPDVYQKICTIRIYRTGEILPLVSIELPRLSMLTLSKIPKGSVLPWYGNLKNIPQGFALCNGAEGTPDLRDRFLVGAGDSYTLGVTGGVNEVLLEAEQTANHYHRFGYHNNDNTGYFLTSEGTRVQAPLASWMRAGYWNGRGGGSYTGQPIGAGQNMVTSLAVGVDAHKPHENRPPFFSVYYIIKL